MQGYWNRLQISSSVIKQLKSPRSLSLNFFPLKLVTHLSKLTSNPLNPIIRKRSDLDVSSSFVIPSFVNEIVNKSQFLKSVNNYVYFLPFLFLVHCSIICKAYSIQKVLIVVIND